MSNFSIAYKDLLNKSMIAEDLLLEQQIIDRPIRGRFRFHQKVIKELSTHFQNSSLTEFKQKYSFHQFAFSLVELYELTYILENLALFYHPLSDISKGYVKNSLNKVLAGPEFAINENPPNNGARNYQFELRMASAFDIDLYNALAFAEHPDITLTVNNRCYSIECKRLFSVSLNTVKQNITKAIDQLEKYRGRNFAGIIGLDLSRIIDGGSFLLNAENRSHASLILQNGLKNYLDFLLQEAPEILQSSERGFVIALLLNSSNVYILEDPKEIGWVQYSVLCDLNQSTSHILKSDFCNLIKTYN